MGDLRYPTSTPDDDMAVTYKQEMKGEVGREVYWGWYEISLRRRQERERGDKRVLPRRRLVRKQRS
jgi:hypothetical protein